MAPLIQPFIFPGKVGQMEPSIERFKRTISVVSKYPMDAVSDHKMFEIWHKLASVLNSQDSSIRATQFHSFSSLFDVFDAGEI